MSKLSTIKHFNKRKIDCLAWANQGSLSWRCRSNSLLAHANITAIRGFFNTDLVSEVRAKGGTNAHGPNTTYSINNLGAKGLNIYNLRLNYEQFTHSEVQNGFPKNRWLVPYFGNGMIASTSATPVAGTAYLEEFEVPEDSFLDGISYVKGATQAGNVRVGVYGPIATEETCDHARLLVQSASTAVSADPNIDQFVSFPKTLAHAGRYYAAIEFSDATNTFQRYPNITVVTGWSQTYAVCGGYGAFTDPCPSPTNTGTNMPSLKIRCASLTVV